MSAAEFNFYTLRIGEIAFISANFDMGVSCSSIFVFKGIVYDVVHTRLE